MRIIITDDHEVVRRGLKKKISEMEGFSVVGEAGHGAEAFMLAQELKPDAIIMDIFMPNMNGLEATRKILKEIPHTKILIYSLHVDSQLLTELLKAGISGYVTKDCPISEIETALLTVKGGGMYFSRSVSETLSGLVDEKKGDAVELKALSGRELEVFKLLADGLKIQEIGDKLCISPKTVETHKYNIMEKLGVHSRAGLTKIALKNKMIEI